MSGYIKKDLREIGCNNGRWIEWAQDRAQCWAVMNIGVVLSNN
jgi:hypothetical protein